MSIFVLFNFFLVFPLCNRFADTPGIKRGIESPSAWKSPWFVNSLLPAQGHRFDTDVLYQVNNNVFPFYLYGQVRSFPESKLFLRFFVLRVREVSSFWNHATWTTKEKEKEKSI